MRGRRQGDSVVTYHLVIFDFDGTLADSFPWFVKVFDTLAERYHFRRITEQEGAALRGLRAPRRSTRRWVGFLPTVRALDRFQERRCIEGDAQLLAQCLLCLCPHIARPVP